MNVAASYGVDAIQSDETGPGYRPALQVWNVVSSNRWSHKTGSLSYRINSNRICVKNNLHMYKENTYFEDHFSFLQK